MACSILGIDFTLLLIIGLSVWMGDKKGKVLAIVVLVLAIIFACCARWT